MNIATPTFQIEFTQDQAPGGPANVLALLRENGFEARAVTADPGCAEAPRAQVRLSRIAKGNLEAFMACCRVHGVLAVRKAGVDFGTRPFDRWTTPEVTRAHKACAAAGLL